MQVELKFKGWSCLNDPLDPQHDYWDYVALAENGVIRKIRTDEGYLEPGKYNLPDEEFDPNGEWEDDW